MSPQQQLSPCRCPGAPQPPSPALLKRLNGGIAARVKPGGRESWRGADWLWVQLPAARNPGEGGGTAVPSGAPGAAGAPARSAFFGGSHLWVQVGTANSRHRGGVKSGFAAAVPRHPRPPLGAQAAPKGAASPNPDSLVPATLPCGGARSGTSPAGEQGWGQWRGVPPALPPAAWGRWRGQGMAAICRACLNKRPPRKISRPPPRPSIVFGTRCCFFRLLSYFSLTFFPDLRHMPSPCPAALN